MNEIFDVKFHLNLIQETFEQGKIDLTRAIVLTFGPIGNWRPNDAFDQVVGIESSHVVLCSTE